MLHGITAILGPGSWGGPKNVMVDDVYLRLSRVDVFTVQSNRPLSAVQQLYEFLRKVERICVSLFMVDLSPRIIDGFLYRSIPVEQAKKDNDDLALHLPLILGNPKDTEKYSNPRIDDMNNLMGRSGFMYNASPSNSFSEIDIEELKKWYQFLRDNDVVEQKVSLIMRGFGEVFVLGSNFSYIDYQKVALGILLLVPGLEGLFTNQSSSNNDIGFKFSYVGALFYSIYADEAFLKLAGAQKLSFLEIKEIFKALYNLRSDVAHGQYEKISRSNNWQPLYRLLKVGGTDTTDPAVMIRNAIFAIGLFEKHVVAMIRGAQENLNLGVKIIDQIHSGQEVKPTAT